MFTNFLGGWARQGAEAGRPQGHMSTYTTGMDIPTRDTPHRTGAGGSRGSNPENRPTGAPRHAQTRPAPSPRAPHPPSGVLPQPRSCPPTHTGIQASRHTIPRSTRASQWAFGSSLPAPPLPTLKAKGSRPAKPSAPWSRHPPTHPRLLDARPWPAGLPGLGWCAPRPSPHPMPPTSPHTPPASPNGSQSPWEPLGAPAPPCPVHQRDPKSWEFQIFPSVFPTWAATL